MQESNNISSGLLKCTDGMRPFELNISTGKVTRANATPLPQQTGFRYWTVRMKKNHIYCDSKSVKEATKKFQRMIDEAKKKQLRIGIVIPTRGDRPQFIEQAKRLLAAQTRQPDELLVVDYKPKSESKDLAERHKHGLTELFARGCHIVFLWEDDDWYHPQYIETMLKKWEELERPVLLGLSSTTYYHIGVRKYGGWKEQKRACAFHTLVKNGAVIDVCADDAIDFDRKLWHANVGITFEPEINLCLGIKHGVGMAGGNGHNAKWRSYTHQDQEWKFFDSIVTSENQFYKNISR